MLTFMNEEMLNTVFSASLEFGKNFRRPIIEIVEEAYSHLSSDEKKFISHYIEETREAIEGYFHDKYDFRNEKANISLQDDGKEWIKNKYCWMSSENVDRAAHQGMYFAWHG